MDEILVVIGPDYHIKSMNQFGLEVLRYKKEDVLGKSFSTILMTEGEWCSWQLSLENLQETTFSQEMELTFLKRDGHQLPVTLQNCVIHDEQNKVREIICVAQRRNNLLPKKQNSLENFAGGIAHNLNNICTIVLGNTEILQVEFAEKNQVNPYLEDIWQACGRAGKLIEQVFIFSSLKKASYSSVDVAEAISITLEELKGTLPENIDIQYKVQKNCNTIQANLSQIYQVITNLCSNAHHAMEKTGGILKVTLEQRDNFLLLIVKDTGIGISAVEQEQVFTPFFSTKETKKGVGLGLSLVQGIVRNLHGEITLESKLGQGTQVSVLFPLPKQRSLIEASKVSFTCSGSGHILIVDDEPLIGELYREIIEEYGFSTTVITNASLALSLFQKDPQYFDLVVTDLEMPLLTGVELSQQLLKLRPNLPIILNTGNSVLLSEVRVTETGIREYLSKPVQLSTLIETIEKLLK